MARIETDSLGEIEVADHALWGAQTQRSLQNFVIGNERMPRELIRAFAIVKRAAAKTNQALAKLDEERCDWIKVACDEILQGHHYEQFPLVIWQTGSGTQSNMNAKKSKMGQAAKCKLRHSQPPRSGNSGSRAAVAKADRRQQLILSTAD